VTEQPLRASDEAYEAARDRFVDAFRAARRAGDGKVRLAKRTTNLFRPRSGARTAGVPVEGLASVIAVEPGRNLARVGGMTTYETLVEDTLPHGRMPTVVPELKSITVGGAVTGVGIESSSWKHGLVHESVQGLEILTGAGEVVTAEPEGPHSDLFFAFPNSYGTLGYALSVDVNLQETSPFVRLVHRRFGSAGDLLHAMSEVCDSGVHDGRGIDFVDGSVFAPDEMYMTLGTFANTASASTPSDYTWMGIYHRSIRERTTDLLTVHDYLWRWDTDWFWCSGNLGFERPWVRLLAGRELLRSTTYRRILSMEHRWRLTERKRRLFGENPREPVIQDVELPVSQAEEFLRFFDAEIGIRPVWICPTRASRDGDRYPLYSMKPGELYINFGFWSSAELQPGMAEGDHNKRIEAVVDELGGRKSLYSTSYYDRETFDRIYNAEAYEKLKATYDPDACLPDLHAKTVDRA
jgi:FAD/FMN-containing dehydrogenase